MPEEKTKSKTEKVFTCFKCGDELERRYSNKNSGYFWQCLNATEICGEKFGDRDGEPVKPCVKGEPDRNVLCPECESPMVKITGGAHGDFYSCSRHKETGCKGTIDILPDGSLPPLCSVDPEHGPMRFIRKSKNGPFLSCRRWKDVQCQAKLDLPKAKKTSVA